jgi:hypothetical protein
VRLEYRFPVAPGGVCRHVWSLHTYKALCDVRSLNILYGDGSQSVWRSKWVYRIWRLEVWGGVEGRFWPVYC